jgi:AbrB family looped-hinge helix DNA binding protein
LPKVKVTRNFQVTIPEEVRKKIRLSEGDTVEIEVLDSTQLVLKRVIPLGELKGAWANDPSIDSAMEEVRKDWKNRQKKTRTPRKSV